MLREQGAAALKAQLADTIPFVELLFARERDAEPLDTPERRAGLQGSGCARPPAPIADTDLAEAYRDELLAAFRRAVRRRARRRQPRAAAGGAAVAGRPTPIRRLTAEGRAAGQRARRATSIRCPPPWPRRALADPAVLDAHLEALERARLRRSGAGSIWPRKSSACGWMPSTLTPRRCTPSGGRGFGALLSDIDRAAAKSGAPFLRSDVPLALARSQWSHAFEALNSNGGAG